MRTKRRIVVDIKRNVVINIISGGGAPAVDNLLLENGDDLLLEDGSLILLETA